MNRTPSAGLDAARFVDALIDNPDTALPTDLPSPATDRALFAQRLGQHGPRLVDLFLTLYKDRADARDWLKRLFTTPLATGPSRTDMNSICGRFFQRFAGETSPGTRRCSAGCGPPSTASSGT